MEVISTAPLPRPPPLIFVISPLRWQEGDPSPSANLRFVESICREISLTGAIPFAPHLYFTRFLDDCIVAERNLGIKLGLAVLKRADEVFVRRPYWRRENSSGMLQEIGEAERLVKPIYNVTDGEEFTKQLARLREIASL